MTMDAAGERRTSGAAIASLVLGIVGVTVFPLIPSIFAIIFGGRAREEMRDPGVTGEGLATAGIILGWIGVALGALGLVLAVLALAIALP